MSNQKITIQKTVYNKEGLSKVVNRSFTEFASPTPVEDPDTVEELFRLYEKLYFTIPVEGELSSHEYLVNRSSELVNTDLTNEQIQPLLDEIALLRTELLEANEEIANLTSNLANGGN